MTIEITALTEADRPRWTAMWGAYLDFYKATVPEAVYDLTWSRLVGGGPVHGLAARRADGIVGITHYLFHPSGWTLADYCYLQDLFVDEAARGEGVGRKLIEAVAADARARGADRMYWMTQDHNATARLLYDRIAKHSGFIRYEYPALR